METLRNALWEIERPHNYVPCPECGGINLFCVVYREHNHIQIRCKNCDFECKDWPTKDEERLQEIEERCAAATPGPWYVDGCYSSNTNIRTEGPGWPLCSMSSLRENRMENAIFIAHARADVPALVAEVWRLKAKIEEIEKENDELRRRIHLPSR